MLQSKVFHTIYVPVSRPVKEKRGFFKRVEFEKIIEEKRLEQLEETTQRAMKWISENNVADFQMSVVPTHFKAKHKLGSESYPSSYDYSVHRYSIVLMYTSKNNNSLSE